MGVSPSEFEFVSAFAKKESGIVLEPGKEYLVDSRLDGVRRVHNLDSVSEVIARLRQNRDPKLRQAVLDSLTTNETTFFRDMQPFEMLKREILPEIASRKEVGPINIWCAACSTGQEPYSIALLLKENFADTFMSRTYLLGTDLSSFALERARLGHYSQLEVNRGLPAAMLLRYFKSNGRDFVLSEEIRKMVDLREINLIANWPYMPKMDVIFIRNVLIYFDAATKRAILSRMRDALAPGGYLVIGSTETMLDTDLGLERVELGRSLCYRPKR